MNLPTRPIEIIGEIKPGETVFIRSQQDFHGLKYNVSQVGHIERIDGPIALIDWHHGMAPKEKVNVAEINQYQIN